MNKKKRKRISHIFVANIFVVIVCLVIATSITTYFTFINFYESEVINENDKTAGFIYNVVQNFVDGVFNVSSEVLNNENVISMKTDLQAPIFADCVTRNQYIELIYAQDMTGMQTGRSSGNLSDRSSRWWFKDIIQNPRNFVSKSYYSTSTKMPCTSIFMPIRNNSNDMIGVLGIDIKLSYIQELIEKFSDTENGNYSFIIDGEGNVVAHPNSQYMEEVWNFKTKTKQIAKKDAKGNSNVDKNGDVITEEVNFEISEEYENVISSVLAGNTGNSEITFEDKNYYVSYAPIPMEGESDSWAVISLQDKDMTLGVAYKIVSIIIAVSIVVLIVAILIIIFLTKKITKPLGVMTNVTQKMTDGDLKCVISYNDNTEVGLLVSCLNEFSENLHDVIGDIDYILSEMSKGNMTVKPKIQYKGDFISIEKALVKISNFLNTTMSRINAASDQVFGGAKNVFETADALSEGAIEQANSVGRLSDTIDKISQKIQDTAINTKNAEARVESVYEKINNCNEQLDKMLDTMSDIKKCTDQLDIVIKAIEDIAFQTNLLAINASVEAARASEFGVGFSVIARDIKVLSEKSSNENKNSSKIINQSVEVIEEGTNLILEISKNLKNIVEDAQNMAITVKEISCDSEEQVDLIVDLSTNVDKISGVVQANSAASTESAAAAKELSEQAGRLKDIVNEFKLK